MAKDKTLRQVQEETRRLRRSYFPHWERQSTTIGILDLIAETGSLVETYLKAIDDSENEDLDHATEEIERRLGDVIYSLVSIANKLNVSLQHSLDESIVGYYWNPALRKSEADDEKALEQKELMKLVKRLGDDMDPAMEKTQNQIIGKVKASEIPFCIMDTVVKRSKIAKEYLRITHYGRMQVERNGKGNGRKMRGDS